MALRGRFIAIEGGDGSGKGTQTEQLLNYLKSINKNVMKISFPQYGKPSAQIAELYLNGKFGSAGDVPADLASLAYAIDRFDASKEIREFLQQEDGLVIADRYVASNLAHQGTKFEEKEERQAFYDRLLEIEYEILGLPKPDKNIVLLVPSTLAQRNVDKKDTRTYTSKKRDIHEADKNHLDRAKENYEELCQLYPEEFTALECTNKNGHMRSIEEIHESIKTILDL